MNSLNYNNYNNLFYGYLFFNSIINKNFFINGISFINNQLPAKNISKEIFRVIKGKKETEKNFSVSSSESSSLFKNTESDSISDKENEIKFIGNKRSKVKRPRKENQDNIRRKIKRAFFNNALIKKLNNKLKSSGSIKYLEKFPQIFVCDGNINKNKKIIDMTLKEIFETKELYANEDKEGLFKYELNLKVIQSEEIKENEEFQKILNKKFSELYTEYINSDEFNIDEINRLREKKMGDEYINRYKYLAKNLVEYFSQ